MKRLKNPPLLINTQHYSSRSQYGGRRRLSRLSSILRATHPQQTLTCRQTGKVEIRRLRMQITRSQDCACVVRTLEIAQLEIGMQSQDSENAQRNLEIAQILRLRRTYTDSFVMCYIQVFTVLYFLCMIPIQKYLNVTFNCADLI